MRRKFRVIGVYTCCLKKGKKLNNIDFNGTLKGFWRNKNDIVKLISFLNENYDFYHVTLDMGFWSKKICTISTSGHFRIMTIE